MTRKLNVICKYPLPLSLNIADGTEENSWLLSIMPMELLRMPMMRYTNVVPGRLISFAIIPHSIKHFGSFHRRISSDVFAKN
jgi:hypothetical protein